MMVVVVVVNLSINGAPSQCIACYLAMQKPIWEKKDCEKNENIVALCKNMFSSQNSASLEPLSKLFVVCSSNTGKEVIRSRI